MGETAQRQSLCIYKRHFRPLSSPLNTTFSALIYRRFGRALGADSYNTRPPNRCQDNHVLTTIMPFPQRDLLVSHSKIWIESRLT